MIVNIVDVSYGGENGFNQVSVACTQCAPGSVCAILCAELASASLQAIELSTDILANVKFIQEKKLIAKCDFSALPRATLRACSRSMRRYFDEISQDTGKYCFGVDDTLQCLDMGAVETLIVWENLEVRRARSLRLRRCGALNHRRLLAGEPPCAHQPPDRRDVCQAPDS